MTDVNITETSLYTSLADDDTIFVTKDGDLGQAAVSTVASEIAEGLRWSTVAASKYTSLPPDADTLTMSDTDGLEAGMPIAAFQGTAYRYGIITAVTTDTSITIRGAGLLDDETVGTLIVGKPEMVAVMELFIPGAYASQLTESAIHDFNKLDVRWNLPPAYLVSVSLTQDVAEASNQPKVNIISDGNDILTADSSLGLTLGTSRQEIVNSGKSINTARYRFVFGDDIEVGIKRAGTTASDLAITLLFVME